MYRLSVLLGKIIFLTEIYYKHMYILLKYYMYVFIGVEV